MAEAGAPLAGPSAQAAEAEVQATGPVSTGVRLERRVHRKKLAEIFYKETWWLCTSPCNCGGYGCVSSETAPTCISHDKHCCIENLCQSDSSDDCCFDISKMCCIVNHWSCPPGGGPNDGVPIFACCGQRCEAESGCTQLMLCPVLCCLECCDCGIGARAKSDKDVMIKEDAELMKETFFLYYCLCMGCGISSCSEPFCMSNRKCCCVRSSCYTTDACPSDRDCIYSHSKCFCCINACTCPSFGGKPDGLPACACFGSVIFGAPASLEESEPLVAVPAQEAMVAAP